MTKPQIWVAAFLLLFMALFILQKATKRPEAIPIINNDSPMMNQEITSELSGYDLMSKHGCLNCHGASLQGSPMGPPLENLKKYWDRDKLISYLRNPNSFMEQSRFKDYKEKYPQMIMPAYNNLDIKELGKMADYLLSKE
jgi:mono/diheme cytochrome c family protein